MSVALSQSCLFSVMLLTGQQSVSVAFNLQDTHTHVVSHMFAVSVGRIVMVVVSHMFAVSVGKDGGGGFTHVCC